MSDDRRPQLRSTFEEVPELYDRARPSYPAELFDDLASLAELGDGARILEVGCGTGQATMPLAARGYRITCIELGERLAALARRNVAAFPAVDVVTGDFETWRPSARDFDAVVAFTAFHWLDPQLRYEKSADLLREGGSLAVAETRHVLPQNGDDFFADVQEDYRAVMPDEDDGPPPRPEGVPDLSDEIGASGHFEQATVERYVWDVIYTATSYIDVLDTYSGHRALEKAAREELYARIRRRIEARPGGIVRKSYLATLNVARRR